MNATAKISAIMNKDGSDAVERFKTATSLELNAPERWSQEAENRLCHSLVEWKKEIGFDLRNHNCEGSVWDRAGLPRPYGVMKGVRVEGEIPLWAQILLRRLYGAPYESKEFLVEGVPPQPKSWADQRLQLTTAGCIPSQWLNCMGFYPAV